MHKTKKANDSCCLHIVEQREHTAHEVAQVNEFMPGGHYTQWALIVVIIMTDKQSRLASLRPSRFTYWFTSRTVPASSATWLITASCRRWEHTHRIRWEQQVDRGHGSFYTAIGTMRDSNRKRNHEKRTEFLMAWREESVTTWRHVRTSC